MSDKKQEYWDHFLTLKNYWGYGVTLKRLEKIKSTIWDDKDFWSDILLRHSGQSITPIEMKNNNFANYQHCFGNFAGMIYQTLIRHEVIKK